MHTPSKIELLSCSSLLGYDSSHAKGNTCSSSKDSSENAYLVGTTAVVHRIIRLLLIEVDVNPIQHNIIPFNNI